MNENKKTNDWPLYDEQAATASATTDNSVWYS